MRHSLGKFCDVEVYKEVLEVGGGEIFEGLVGTEERLPIYEVLARGVGSQGSRDVGLVRGGGGVPGGFNSFALKLGRAEEGLDGLWFCHRERFGGAVAVSWCREMKFAAGQLRVEEMILRIKVASLLPDIDYKPLSLIQKANIISVICLL